MEMYAGGKREIGEREREKMFSFYIFSGVLACKFKKEG